MNIKLFIILSIYSITTFAGREGNGAGGEINVFTQNSAFSKTIVNKDYQKELLKHKNVYKCSDEVRILKTNKFIEKYFEFSLEGFWGRYNFSYDQVCSESAWIKAYNQFMFNLNFVDSNDIVTKHLIKTIAKFNTKIKVVIEKSGNTVGGIKEFSWFDHESNELHYSFRSQNLGNALFGRQTYGIIRHELSHLLIKLSLGNDYPNIDKWHDYGIDCKDKDLSHCIGDQNLDPRAAFIEGMAFALEAGTGLNNLIVSTGNLNWFDDRGKQTIVNNLPTFKSGLYNAATLSDLFTSPTVSISDINYLKDASVSDLTFNKVVFTANSKHLITAIDVLSEGEIQNIRDFAIAFDKKINTNIAYYWLKQFYLIDYKETPNSNTLISEIKISSNGNYKNIIHNEVNETYNWIIDKQRAKTQVLAYEKIVKEITKEEFSKGLSLINSNLKITNSIFVGDKWAASLKKQLKLINFYNQNSRRSFDDALEIAKKINRKTYKVEDYLVRVDTSLFAIATGLGKLESSKKLSEEYNAILEGVNKLDVDNISVESIKLYEGLIHSSNRLLKNLAEFIVIIEHALLRP